MNKFEFAKRESTDGTGRWRNFKTYNWWEEPFPFNNHLPFELTHTIEEEHE